MRVNQGMKTQIDLKSALCGLAVGVLAMLAIGAETSPNGPGRYQAQLVSTSYPADRGYALVIDTQTGKVWTTTLTLNWPHAGNIFDPKN